MTFKPTLILSKHREKTNPFSFDQLRVLKLAQSWKTMGQLLSTIGKSMGALGNITVILGIIIYIFAVVGMEIFGTKYTTEVFGDNIPRYNFKNFGNSFMMIFRILCGKWIEPQWDLLRATSAASIIFIFMVFVVGRWVVSISLLTSIDVATMIKGFYAWCRHNRYIVRPGYPNSPLRHITSHLQR